VAHDCGKVLNPLVVEGQIYGGVVQGIGGSLYEQLIYDDDGQPLTASFMDYLLPMASLVPPIELVPFESPSPHNPIGVKGVGEGGILPTYAAIAAALESAIGVPIESLPLSPAQIRDLMKSRS
jgi:CO/xanthine dehydrogenase Mo-binding subunit